MVVLVLYAACVLRCTVCTVCVCVFSFLFLAFFFLFCLLTTVLMVGMVDVFPDIRLVSWPFSWRHKPCRFHAPHTCTQSETRTKNCSIKLAASVVSCVTSYISLSLSCVVSFWDREVEISAVECAGASFSFFFFLIFFLVKLCKSLLEFLRRANFLSSVCRWSQMECRLRGGPACLQRISFRLPRWVKKVISPIAIALNSHY